MTLLEALLYGMVQGITEYLPVSSSAHLILLPRFLGIEDPGLAFDVFLHAGTLAATLMYFWKDWLHVFATIPRLGPWLAKRLKLSKSDPAHGYVSFDKIVYGTIPALIAGAALHNVVEEVFRGPHVVVWTLVFGGVALWAADHFMAKSRGLGKLTTKDSWIVGLIQCLALVPGMSRSGSTITAGRLLGFDRASAARFSFLLSGPVTAAALVFELRKWDQLWNGSVGGAQLVVAGLSSFLFGWLAIGGLLKLIRRFGYLSFAVYRVLLALTVAQVLLR